VERKEGNRRLVKSMRSRESPRLKTTREGRTKEHAHSERQKGKERRRSSSARRFYPERDGSSHLTTMKESSSCGAAVTRKDGAICY